MVSSSDASLHGYGVCTRFLPPEIVAAIGRVPERERFRRGPAVGARTSGLIDSCLDHAHPEDQSIADLLKAGWEVDKDFIEVPRALLHKADWEVKLHGKWKHADDILVLEGYALLKSLVRIAGTKHGQNVRLLLLVDNLPIALSFERRRSRKFKVLRLIRKFSAICLACNLACSVRWIPSEYNAADEPSRFAEPDANSNQNAETPEGGAQTSRQKLTSSPASPEYRSDAVQEDQNALRPKCFGEAGVSSNVEAWPPCHRVRAQQAGGSRQRRQQFLHRDRGPFGPRQDKGPSPPSQTSEPTPQVPGHSFRHFDANTAGTTFLETQAVTAPAQQCYATELEAFRIHAAKHGYNLDNPDLAIAQYLNSLFWKGEQPHKGEKFLAAWLHRYPDFGRIGSRKLPRSWFPCRCVCVWAAVAVEMVKMGQARMALFVLLSVSTYARPSELLRCVTRCLVRPTASALDEWAVLLAPTELPTPTKTGEFDLSVPLDSPYLKPWITVLLEALKSRHPNSPLWDFEYGEYLSTFKAAANRLQINLSPYQTRHSGPSIDRAKKLRTLHEVQKRGNWRSNKSVLRYEKAGRLSLSYQNLKPRIKEEVLLGKRHPPAGP